MRVSVHCTCYIMSTFPRPESCIFLKAYLGRKMLNIVCQYFLHFCSVFVEFMQQ